MKSSQTMLVIRHNGLGDLVVARPALAALRRRFPLHRLVMTCPSWLVPLAEQLGMGDEYITEGQHNVDPSHHQDADSGILRAITEWTDPFDVLVVLRVPEADVLRVLLSVKPRLLLSFRHPDFPETDRFPNLDFAEHIVVRWGRLPALAGEVARLADFSIEWSGPVVEGATIVHPGAASPARRWPVVRWAEVVSVLEASGHRVLLTGSPVERELVTDLQEESGLLPDRNIAGMTSVLELASLVAGARLVLSTDTGISHLAYAFGRPSITLFGAVPPEWWGPTTEDPRHHVLWAGCLSEPYADQPAPGLLEISVRQVLDKLAR